MAVEQNGRRKPYIGRSIPRFEDQRLITGQGRYTDDFNYPNQAYAAFMRSPHPHARIKSIDVNPAQKMPGVLAVITAADYVAMGGKGIDHIAIPNDAFEVQKSTFDSRLGWNGSDPFDMRPLPLTADKVRYVGEPVAMVIADTAAQAREAAEQVAVVYDVLPAVSESLAALAPGAPQLHDGVPGNLAIDGVFGDEAAVAAAFAKAHTVIERTFRNQRIVNAQMEPRSALGAYDPATGVYTLLSGSQGAWKMKMSLAGCYGVAPDKVHAITPDVGGGFGLRTNVYPEQVMVPLAARQIGRPVKWTGDRSECFLTDSQGRDLVTTAKMALDADGRILAMAVDLLGGLGGYPMSYVSLSNGYRIMPTVYHVPVATVRIRAALTNTVPTAPFRGAGRPEGTLVMESLLELAARRLKIDRVELRRRNLIRRAQLPYQTATGLKYDSGDFRGNMAKALELADWKGFAARRRDAKKRGLLAGVAVSNYVESPVGMPWEYVRVTVQPNGGVETVAGTQSTGQGHETTFAQVVADLLGVTPEEVKLITGDTNLYPKGGGTHSDRSMRLAGTLIYQSVEKIVAQAKTVFAALVGAKAEDVSFEDGFFSAPQSNRRLDIYDIARAVDGDPVLPPELKKPLTADASIFGRISAYPTGSVVCEVEVDPETGRVTLTRYTSVDDAGQAINPMVLHGQVHGGIVQGAGQALFETTAHDSSGQVLTGSFMDYAVPRADTMPSFQVELAEDPTKGNPLRIKGGGEAGITPALAVITNAIVDALSPLGVGGIEMPATPARVWQAIRAARGTHAS